MYYHSLESDHWNGIQAVFRYSLKKEFGSAIMFDG